MNCFTIYPLIQSLGKITSDKKQRLLISIFCSAILFILIVIILLVLSNSSNSSMPMLDLAQNISPSFYIFYLITLLLSIFTTLLSCFYSLSEKTALIIKNKTMNSLLCFTSCLAISFIGFNKIITYFYPLVGIIGLVFLIYQIIISNKYRKQKLKSSEITLKINKSVKL